MDVHGTAAELTREAALEAIEERTSY
jgi:hypothetical protein